MHSFSRIVNQSTRYEEEEKNSILLYYYYIHEIVTFAIYSIPNC